MGELLTAEQMRALEQAAIASGSVTGLELMERAGRGVVQAIVDEWPEMAGREARADSAGVSPRTPGYLETKNEQAKDGLRAVVLCGPGNNGGDGFVVARLLKERGWQVEVYLRGFARQLPPDARANHDRWCQMGKVQPFDKFHSEQCRSVDLVVDALFGIGLTRPYEGGIIAADDAARTRLVAVDIPSGLCADTGAVLGARAMPCALTVTFHSAKPGHHLQDGPAHCGKVVVADIGLLRRDRRDPENAWVAGSFGASAFWDNMEKELEWAEARAWLVEQPRPETLAKRGGHKFGHGHALVLAGGPGRGGAGRLAARAALRVGAGLVTLGCPADAMAENAARLEAVMLRAVPDGAALRALLADGRITALCLGPGLGTGAAEADLLAAALGPCAAGAGALPLPPGGRGEGWGAPLRRRLVLDADALTLVSQHPGLFAALHEGCVLTPHGGEFARLFPDLAARLAEPPGRGPAYSKLDATRAAAARAGCTVLLKGPDTVIADPRGGCAVHSAAYDRAAPWLATAGAGDVLAGLITGLLARGRRPQQAAETAAWLHTECALGFGPGLIAEDLPEELPKVFRALGL